MGQPHARAVAGTILQIETKGLAALDLRFAAAQLADADLGTLQIHQDADRPARLFLDLADQGMARAVILVGAMAQIEPENIDTGMEQGEELLAGRAGGPQGGDNLGQAFTSHARNSTFGFMTAEIVSVVMAGLSGPETGLASLLQAQRPGSSPARPMFYYPSRFSIRMARKSFTLVSVGPVLTRSPSA